MINIEFITRKISNNIASELHLDKEKADVINYGIFACAHMLISFFTAAIFGMLFGVTFEALIILLIISVLRQQSGGVHASSPLICNFIGTLISVGMAIIAKNFKFNLMLICVCGLVIFAWSYYVVYKLVPVDSPNKPIKTDVKRKRLKKSSILILNVYLIIVLVNILFYYSTRNENLLIYCKCIYMGLLWQVFSLTQIGHIVLGKLDALFK